jgi:hypothetical protein
MYVMPMTDDNIPLLPRKLERYLDRPYGGLFGNSVNAKVIEEVVADPHHDYRPKELVKLTGASAPAVRRALATLTRLGLLVQDRSDSQHPVYRINLRSKTFVALTLLSLATLDDREGSSCMDTAVKEWYRAGSTGGHGAKASSGEDLPTRLRVSQLTAQRLADALAGILAQIGRKAPDAMNGRRKVSART